MTHVTLVGTWKVSSPPSISSYLEYVNVPCLHLMLPYPEGTCNTPSPILDPGSDKTQPRQEKKTPFLRVEFLLKTDGGHPEKTVVTLSTLGTPGNPFHSSTHRWGPALPAVAHSRGCRNISKASVSRTLLPAQNTTFNNKINKLVATEEEMAIKTRLNFEWPSQVSTPKLSRWLHDPYTVLQTLCWLSISRLLHSLALAPLISASLMPYHSPILRPLNLFTINLQGFSPSPFCSQ